jgi:uncharacterized membrane protein YkvA (DUF1232 family)
MPDHNSKKDAAKAYSEEKLFKKLQRYATSAGIGVVEKALFLWYALQRPETPKWAKAVILSALGYFIMPVDAIMDLTPFLGWADDLAVMTAALAAVSAYVNDDVKTKARTRLHQWFGDLATRG